MTQEEERRLKAEENHGDRRALVGLQVKDLKGLISEEVAAALKQNTDQVNRDVQKQLEPELRESGKSDRALKHKSGKSNVRPWTLFDLTV
ncbi:hypothetical protein J4E90_003316 [Alternaria incomplexa]|uniref:uncharacterized protein n=1 Tax=Alternaria incomplexa TaxID=1187928 RepID=UPI002220AEC6|nr:uncharacterized protein J4E90_003316 [Alternaria incomplexa]KAI4916813.1 hypothetical protein J4E90_003316 [Alternaria incomplexa]